MRDGSDITFISRGLFQSARRTRWFVVGLLAVIILPCCFFAGCESPETHIAKAKKLVAAPSVPVPTPVPVLNSTSGVMDLRSSDFESERYLPVLERLERRQQTIIRVLSKQHVETVPKP